MKSSRSRLAAAAITLATVSNALAGSAAASEVAPTSGSPDHMAIAAMVQRFAAAKPTAKDLEYMRRHPKMAGAVLDGRRTSTGHATTRLGASATDRLLGSSAKANSAWRCHQVDRYLVARSVSGWRLYNYHTVVSWCSTGRQLKTTGRTAYFDGVDRVTMRVRNALSTNLWTSAGTGSAGAHTGGLIENCLPGGWGCFLQNNPQQKIYYYTTRGSYTYQKYDRGDGTWHDQA